MHEYHVTMVFGVYAVDYDGEYMKELRKTIAGFIRKQEHVKSFHAVYIDQRSDKIYCDFIVDYELKDWEELKKEFEQYMAEKYTGKEVVLTIETEYVWESGYEHNKERRITQKNRPSVFELGKIDISGYKDSMIPLIKKDIAELRELIEEKQEI